MKIDEMQLLMRVAEAGSMSRAAGQIGRTPAAVSAAIQRIEASLGLRLFERTTRSLRPTDEGAVVLEGCEQTVMRWQRTLDEARGRSATLEGTVRIAAPVDTTHQVLETAVAAFAAAHPQLRVVVYASDALQNVWQDALDISIRYGALDDSTLVARKLASSPRILVASPAYLATAGEPRAVSDLPGHQLLTLQLGNTPEQMWELRDDEGKAHPVNVASSLCGDGLLVRRWALAGHGIACKGLFDVVDDLLSGRLVRVLPNVAGHSDAIHAVMPSNKFIPLRVRALVDDLAPRFEARQRRCTQWFDRGSSVA